MAALNRRQFFYEELKKAMTKVDGTTIVDVYAPSATYPKSIFIDIGTDEFDEYQSEDANGFTGIEERTIYWLVRGTMVKQANSSGNLDKQLDEFIEKIESKLIDMSTIMDDFTNNSAYKVESVAMRYSIVPSSDTGSNTGYVNFLGQFNYSLDKS